MVNLAKLRKKAKEKKEKASVEMPERVSDGSEFRVPSSELDVNKQTLGTRNSEPGTAGPEPPADKIAAYLATAGESRAATAAAVADVQAPQIELLSFVLAGEQYAVDIDDVVEIVTPRPVTRVPNADPSVVGIFSLRGAVVMLVDLRRKLGHPPASSAGADARVIVVRNESENVGFLVDRVLRVTRTDADRLEPHPVVHSSENDESVRGVFRSADALTIVLDLRKLLFTAWN